MALMLVSTNSAQAGWFGADWKPVPTVKAEANRLVGGDTSSKNHKIFILHPLVLGIPHHHYHKLLSLSSRLVL